MSFVNAGRETQKFILNYSKDTKPFELLQAVLAARALNGSIQETEFTEAPRNGKKRKVKVSYIAPICNDTEELNDTVCGSGRVVEPIQDWFEITRTTASDIYQLNAGDIRNIDGEFQFSQYAKEMIRAAMPQVRTRLQNAIAALLVANDGLQPDGNTLRLLPWVDKSNGVPNPMGLWEIERIYRDAGLAAPFVIGGSDAFYWRKAVPIGGVADNGLNVAQMGRTNVYYDSVINTTYADTNYEHVLTFDPNLLKFVSYSENAGQFATTATSVETMDAMYSGAAIDFLKGALVDPVTGLLWDLNIDFDKTANDCQGAWKFQWKLRWDIIFMPPQVCNIQGLNGIMHFTTCAPKQVTCPSGSLITPASTDNWDFETSGVVTFPYNIYKFQLAGQTNILGTPENVADLDALVAFFNANYNGITFAKSGTKIRYVGYNAISGSLNDGDVTVTFS